MKTARTTDFAKSGDIRAVFYQVTSGTRTFITKYMPCPVQLLHLAHPQYENRHLTVADSLIMTDAGNNRFQQFALYNKAKYYPHVTDETSTTLSLLDDTLSAFYDPRGNLVTNPTTSALWTKAIDTTTAWGIQMGQFVFNAYEYYYTQFAS